ncbi:hypothetical protein PIB30_062536 [Stylosanthes scabra]|uniref:Uncharacterized protein n=1 Tax=Stylosanthes scabra TaxID=79078 RepID=A0ABU6SL61_9FABA|nr:hypothetical protein [Stylosanthes scabra]
MREICSRKLCLPGRQCSGVVRIFTTCFVDVCVVHTHTPLSVAFGYHYHIAEPRGVLNLPDESGFEEALNLLFCFSHFFRAHASQFLCNRLTSVDYRQLVAGEIGIYSGHIYRGPHEERSPSGFGLSWIFLAGGSRSTKRHPLAVSGFPSFGSYSFEMCKDGSCYDCSYPVKGRSFHNRIVGGIVVDD